jgi:alpha-L-rhamnosidase
MMKVLLIPFLCLPLMGSTQHLVTPSDHYVKNRWEARWIGPEEGAYRYGVHYFRKSFSLKTKPYRFVIHLSADNRYRFFVNGTYVTDGPQINDTRHWRFESLDIGPLMKEGENVLAVQVANFAEEAPVYLMGKRTALIMQGDDSLSAIVNTDKTWKYLADKAVTPLVFKPGDPSLFYQYYAAGPLEKVEGTNFPWGWELPDYNDTSWPSAQPSETGAPFGIVGYGDATWELVPRSIPLMERTYQNSGPIRRSSGIPKVSPVFPITIPARTTASILVDQQVLTSAFPELTSSGGKDSQIKVTYAEALFEDIKMKGHRDSIRGKTIHGVYDVFLPEGNKSRNFTTLTYRTFRYVQLDITTGNEPLAIEKFGSWFTAYPFEKKASFASNDPALAKVFNIGWHTARLCAYETYMDCPYWERLQYIGDTRIQALVSYYVSGDDRLAKNALEQFQQSLTYDGLTYSRYPSSLPQYIPNYSLVWVTMVHDYFMYRNDPEFVKSFLPGIQRVLDHFEQYMTPDNMMREQPYWDFIDHTFPTHKIVEESFFKRLTTNSLFYAYTLSLASEMFGYYNEPKLAQKYSVRSQQLKTGVKKQCWDANRQLYADTPDKKHFSMHSNILAVLCGMVPKEEQQDFVKRIVESKNITQTTLYFDFYLGRAMNQAHAGDLYLGLLDKWKELLDVGLTTFPEGVDRSECHAWSASPDFEMLATFAGIQPQTPGFKKVIIRPLLQKLESVKGNIPHWAGELSVDFNKNGNQLTGTVVLPSSITGRLEWNGKVVELKSGENKILVN